MLAELDQDDVLKETGCHLPCTYRHYEIDGLFLFDQDKFGFQLYFSSKTEIVKKEVWTYGPESLTAEFGGALSLFTGFSFFMLHDVLKFIIVSTYKFLK